MWPRPPPKSAKLESGCRPEVRPRQNPGVLSEKWRSPGLRPDTPQPKDSRQNGASMKSRIGLTLHFNDDGMISQCQLHRRYVGKRLRWRSAERWIVEVYGRNSSAEIHRDSIRDAHALIPDCELDDTVAFLEEQ